MTEARPISPRMQRMQARILDAAREVFLGHGFDAANMDAIAARADVSKQTLYAHFGGKDALFAAMVEALTSAAIAARDTAAPLPDGDPAEVLAEYALAQLATAHSPVLMQLRRVAIAEAARRPDIAAQVWAAGPGRSIDALALVFARWHEAGRLNAPDPARAARVFNWLVMGGPTSEAMLLGTPATADPPEAAAHAREAVRVFLAAYGA